MLLIRFKIIHTSPKTLSDRFIISPAVIYIGWLDNKIIIKSLPAFLLFILYHCIVQAWIPTFLAYIIESHELQ